MQKQKRKKFDPAVMKDMRFGEKVNYILVHFKYHLLVALILVLFIGFLVQAATGGKDDPVFTAYVTGAAQEKLDSAAAAFGAFAGLDAEREPVSFSPGDPEAVNTEEGQHTLITTVAYARADVLLTPELTADYLLKNGGLSDLQVVLPAAALERYAHRLWYADADALKAWMEASKEEGGSAPAGSQLSPGSAGMTAPVPVALDVTAEAREKLGLEGGETVLLTVAVTDKHLERTADFLRFLCGDSEPFPAEQQENDP
ncbi:MAG: hypothetical protein IJU29_08970 [Oscillospiraceae bacterium]|nr:hypothetical protein [Oscillospiraceae bacterium]